MINRLKNKYQYVKRNKLMYHPLYWRYVLNPISSLKHTLHMPKLNETQRHILTTLNRDGVVRFPFTDLFCDDTLFNELSEFYKNYQEENKNEIEKMRIDRSSNKPYLYSVSEKSKLLKPTNPMLKISKHPLLFNIVNNYLGLKASLRSCDIWHTFTSSEPTRSQNWHRDQEDFRMVKAFIYLNDVDEAAGPFVYAKRSHTKGIYFRDPVWFKEDGHHNKRSTDAEVERVISRSQWLTATGKAGTVILADTRGLHKGGFATEKERIAFTCMYVSPSSYFRPAFTVTTK